MANDLNVWSDWAALVKQTVARFARGNVSAQRGVIMLQPEQERERERVKLFTLKWKQRAERARS